MSNINAQSIINEIMQAHAIAPSEYTWGDFITFKTSARGSHRVLNCKENLQRFADLVRKNAAAFGGGLIREEKQKPSVSYPPRSISLYKQLIEDRDYFAALQLAEEKLSPLFFFGTHGKAYMQVAPIPLEDEPRFVSTLSEDGRWAVIEPVSMLAFSGDSVRNKRSRDAQVEHVMQRYRRGTEESKEAMFSKAYATPADKSAARAKWMADHGIMDDAAIEARIDAQAAQDVAEIVAQAVAVSAIADAMAPSEESTPELVTCEAGESEAQESSTGSASTVPAWIRGCEVGSVETMGAYVPAFTPVPDYPVATTPAVSRYQEILADLEKRASRIGVDKTIEETRANLAGMILSRNFGESIGDFFARNPYLSDKNRAYTDWLNGAKPDTLQVETVLTPAVAISSGTVTPSVAISKEYRYCLVNRPFSIGTAPTDGMIRMDARPTQGYPHHELARHGIAVYGRQLTDQETLDYELAPIADDGILEKLCASVTHEMAEYANEYIAMAADDWVDFEWHVINAKERVTTSFRVSIESNRDFADMVLTALKTATRAPVTATVAVSSEPPAPRPVESTPEPVAPVVGTSTEWAPAIGEKYIGAVECAVAMANMRGDGMEYRVGENAIMERRIKPITLQTTKPDDTAKFNIRAKSGAWFACVYMIGTIYGLRFEAKGMEPITGEFATHKERMQALEMMANALNTPPDGGMPIATVDAHTEAHTPPVAECTPGAPVAVSRAKPEHDLKVGDVVRSSWGYDQTNVNHYQITRLIGKRTVEVRELAEHKDATGHMTGRVAPVWGEFISEPMRRTVDRHGQVNILREKFGRASKIEPVAVVHGVRCYASTGYSSYA